MPDIPPRQPVNGTASARVESAYGLPPLAHGDQPPDIDATGALVSLHQAATQSGPDSFPVLKAFQEYLESERQRARRRVALVTALFAGIVVVLIAVFLAAGLLLFNYMKEREERLWHRLETQTAAPAPVPAPVPAVEPAPPATASVELEQELNRISEALAALTQERAAAGSAAAVATPPTPPRVEPAVTAPPVAPPAPAPVAPAPVKATTVATAAPAPEPAAATPASPAPAAASHRSVALEIPPGATPPDPPAGFAESGIYLRPGGRGAPIPWRVLVPAP